MGKRNRNKPILPKHLNARFKVLNKIGEGGSSVVRICRENTTGKKFVVKIIDKKDNDNDDPMKEISILKQLDHPNIIKYIAHEDTSKKLYLVTEYVEGETIAAARGKYKLSEHDVAFIMVQLINGLSYLHNLGFVHRDITANNLFIRFENNKVSALKIGDFGLAAKLIDDIQVGTVGTPGFMAPEMLGMVHNYKVDIYSAGIVLQCILISPEYYLARHYLHLPHLTRLFASDGMEMPNSELVDLIDNMTEENPMIRYSITDVLNHPWIKTYTQRE